MSKNILISKIEIKPVETPIADPNEIVLFNSIANIFLDLDFSKDFVINEVSEIYDQLELVYDGGAGMYFEFDNGIHRIGKLISAHLTDITNLKGTIGFNFGDLENEIYFYKFRDMLHSGIMENKLKIEFSYSETVFKLIDKVIIKSI